MLSYTARRTPDVNPFVHLDANSQVHYNTCQIAPPVCLPAAVKTWDATHTPHQYL